MCSACVWTRLRQWHFLAGTAEGEPEGGEGLVSDSWVSRGRVHREVFGVLALNFSGGEYG